MLGLDFSGYRLTSGTLNGNFFTRRLKPGKTYGHVIRTTRYFQLYPVDINIHSTLTDTKQLEFDKQGPAWQWRVHLDSFTEEQENTQLLRCRFPKIRIQETIIVSVTEGDEGQLSLVLDIV